MRKEIIKFLGLVLFFGLLSYFVPAKTAYAKTCLDSVIIEANGQYVQQTDSNGKKVCAYQGGTQLEKDCNNKTTCQTEPVCSSDDTYAVPNAQGECGRSVNCLYDLLFVWKKIEHNECRKSK